MLQNPITTTGLIEGRGQYDWYAGGNSPIKRKELIPQAGWKSIKNPHEIQFINYGKDNGYDTLMCVFYNGVTDGLEYLLTQQINLGLVPNWKLDWLKAKGYFKNGFVNFSERFVGINGGISAQGASIWEGINAARNKGLIPNDMFPMADSFYDNINPKFITKEMYDLGKEFANLFHINFEWVDDSKTSEFIKYSPLISIGYYGNQDGTEPLDPPASGIRHCMLEIGEADSYREIDDSYWQQFKTYKRSALSNFMALYIDASDNSMFNEKDFIKTHDKYIVRNRGNGAFGVIYQETPFIIENDRAGLFMIDRMNRGLISDGKNLVAELSEEEFNKIDWSRKF